MSQRKRIVLAAAVLAVAFAVVPAPSEAAGLRGEGLFALDLWERAWVWVARLGEPRARWEKEGGAIDPNGSPKPGSAAPAPDTNTTETGGGVDPNGAP